MYLKGLVEEVTGVELEDEILPELPIKRDLVWPDQPSSTSVKVDYVLFSKRRHQVFFVELKTCAESRRVLQDDYLVAAQRLGFGRILRGFCDILRDTSAHQKYFHLASALARLGYLELPLDLREYVYPTPRLGLSQRLRAVRVTGVDSLIEVLYVQPEVTEGVRCIDFSRFSEYVARHDDPLSQTFARHLLRWRAPAGSCEPL